VVSVTCLWLLVDCAAHYRHHMASSSPLPRREPDGHGIEVRLRIAAAARDLFASQGYEKTTVEAIAERAGVARRTFFRHFRSKDDAIFPDHAGIAAMTEAHLEALGDVPPITALASGVKMIFRSYVDAPVVSVERYRLTRSVPALRDREIASVSRYTRLFSSYLRRRFGDEPGAGLRAEAVAAAYVAAHNHVLRAWLRSSGEGDPMPALDAAFEWVAARFGADVQPVAQPVASPPASAASGVGASAEGEDVVVAVFRSGEPMDDVVERISRSL
jgi:AcrR family transcriptional regulator